MSRGLALLVLLVAVVIGLGVYLDWFKFSTGKSEDGGKMTVDLTIDKDKMKADADAAKEKAGTIGPKARAAAPADSPTNPPSPRR
jgi:hypothetical protein